MSVMPFATSQGSNSLSDIDIFLDVVRLIVDWQSSRIRRALNRLLDTPIRVREEAEGRTPPDHVFSILPRCPCLLDASAILDLVTGRSTNLPTYEQLGDARLRLNVDHYQGIKEPRAFFYYPDLPDDQLTEDDKNGAAWGSVFCRKSGHDFNDSPLNVRQLTYQETREILGYLACILDELTVKSGIALREEIAAESPDASVDVLRRLARFGPSLSLSRLPGTIRLPWVHPHEFSNVFVGWSYPTDQPSSETGASNDGDAWAIPNTLIRIDPCSEIPNAAYRLSRPITLYPGQRLLGSSPAWLNSTRSEDSALGVNGGANPPLSGKTRAEEPWHGLISLVPDQATPVGQRWMVTLREVDEPDEGWPVASGHHPVVSGIECSDLAFFVDAPDPTGLVPAAGDWRIDGVLDLARAEHARVERVHVHTGSRAGQTRMVVRDSIIRLGDPWPSRGCLLKDLWINAAGERGILRFGAGSLQNLVVGGEISSQGAQAVGEDGAGIRWDAGSVGNWVLDASIEPFLLPDSRPLLLMEGMAGGVEALYTENGTFGAIIGSTAQDCSIIRTPLSGWVEDQGRGSFVRAETHSLGGGPFHSHSWDNLLGNPGLFLTTVDDPWGTLPAWDLEGAGGQPTRTTLRGAPGIQIEATGGAPVLASQPVSVWTLINPPASPALPEAVPSQPLDEQKASPGPSAVDGGRDFVASCLVGTTGGGRVTLRVEWVVGEAPAAVLGESALEIPVGSPATERELTLRLRTPSVLPDGDTDGVACDLRFIVQAEAGPLRFAAPALIEGSLLPSAPVHPVGPDAGRVPSAPVHPVGPDAVRMSLLPSAPVHPVNPDALRVYGPLSLAQPTAIWTLRSGRALVVPARCWLRSIRPYGAGASLQAVRTMSLRRGGASRTIAGSKSLQVSAKWIDSLVALEAGDVLSLSPSSGGWCVALAVSVPL